GRSVRTGRTRPAARVFDRDAEDLAQFIITISPREHERMLVAHSMGGAISLITLHNHPARVDAAVLSAPMLAINTGNIPRWMARLMAWAAATFGYGDTFVPGSGPWPRLAAGPPGASRVSNDPYRSKLQEAWFGACEDLRLDGPTYAWLHSAFALTARTHGAQFLSRIR